MIKKTITYEDFDGKQVSEDHYFHLSKSELFDMELAGEEAAMSDKLVSIATSGNGAQIMKMFKDIIGAAYGQRVDGSGSKFYKSPQLTSEFMGSLAFDALLTELITNPEQAAGFVNGLLPKDLAATAEQIQKTQRAEQNLVAVPDNPDVGRSGLRHALDDQGTLVPWALREPTEKELMAMNRLQLAEVYQRKNAGWTPPA